jgi:hypothetical protein
MSDTQTQKYTYVVPYRNTRMGALTLYIAVCPVCKKIVKPTYTRRSKAGSHGEDYYVHEHMLSFIILERSNRGRRYIKVPDVLSSIQQELERMWVYEGATVKDIIKLVSLYLSS